MAFVTLNGVSLAFGDRDILQDVNLNISHETRAAIAGANGSGKTTFMRIMAGQAFQRIHHLSEVSTR